MWPKEGMSESLVGLKGQKRVSEEWKSVLSILPWGLRDKRESQRTNVPGGVTNAGYNSPYR